MPKIKIGDVFKTHTGHSIRIIATDADVVNSTNGVALPLVALVTVDGKELVRCLEADGQRRDCPNLGIVMTETFVRLSDVWDAINQSGNMMALKSLVDNLPQRELPL